MRLRSWTAAFRHLVVAGCLIGSVQSVAAQSSSTEPIPSAADALVRPLGRDLAGLVLRDQWIVAAIGGLGSAVGHHWDRDVADSGFLRSATGLNRLGAVVGSFPLLTAEALATYGFGRATGSPRLSRVGAEL